MTEADLVYSAIYARDVKIGDVYANGPMVTKITVGPADAVRSFTRVKKTDVVIEMGESRAVCCNRNRRVVVGRPF